MAKLYFRYSAMNAGKTTQLIQVKHNYEERGQKVLVLKPSIDTRESGSTIKSRIGIECPTIMFDDKTDIIEVIKTCQKKQKIDCLLIDEAQFMTRKQVLQLCSVIDEMNIPCIAYGLRTDFRGELFPGSEALLSFADSIEELKTICWCGKKAIMNTRIKDGKAVYHGEQVQIGGNESYISLCRKHWREGKISDKSAEGKT
jgi:thymidine kinase